MSDTYTAGQLPPANLLPNLPALLADYFTCPPASGPGGDVAFGTSGHRGKSSAGTFNGAHILAITQAICDLRQTFAATGPLFLGKDTHALSEAAFRTALGVLAANGVETRIDIDLGFTPTPVISHAILTHNGPQPAQLADGVVITPSHNPPTDGGFKYNPVSGGPADTGITARIAASANAYLVASNAGVRTIPYVEALAAKTTVRHDYITPYVADLGNVIDMAAIREAKLKLCADALGGSGLDYWAHIAGHYGLDIARRNCDHDPSFRFMCVDHDGKIRMDCSSKFAMAGLVDLKDSYDLAFGNDPDFDRHGIVTPKGGLMNPNHFLSVAVWYLLQHRPGWRDDVRIGKTVVTTSLIDQVVEKLGYETFEVPVGFKWFVEDKAKGIGLCPGTLAFGGEESAGASFLRRDGTVWTTDKDGFILALLAAEILAVTGRDPADIYQEIIGDRTYAYRRVDVPSTPERNAALKGLEAEQITALEVAGAAITAKLVRAPGNGAAIGGLKVTTDDGWFAVRPSGTEAIYKLYGESFLGEEHLDQLLTAAQEVVNAVFAAASL
ncbi:MAG: alpha-D-glucose phosphate-specific phosphoglucomutase [Victivallales bacterium]|nr:alpha-D-glucose phosphate-specific phosphoglucomutase [Victivallales bacterium]